MPYKGPGATCPACGKERYLTRRQAKAAVKRMANLGNGHCSAYECGGFWHIGHMPRHVVRGIAAREPARRPT